MKKAVNISIGQMLFTIEEDAYAKLDDYLKSIRQHFAYTQDHEEIIGDIENRIMEQFVEFKKKIITIKEVETVIASMGTVEDFEHEEGVPAMEAEINEEGRPMRRKLYRNPEDKVVAGVCSGLAAYFNLDAVWIRILFLILIVGSYGFGIILYILMVILIPEAKTASQKLEMEGVPVTLETMKENVMEKEESRKKKRSTLLKALAWPFKMVGVLIQGIIRFLLPFIRIVAGIFITIFALGGMVIASLAASMTLVNGDRFLGFPITEILSGSILYLTVIGAYLTVLIPCILLFILGISIIRKKNLFGFKTTMTFGLVWIGVFVGSAVGGFRAIENFDDFFQKSPLFKETAKQVEISEAEISFLALSDGIHLNLRQGDQPELKITGLKTDLDRLEIGQENGELSLSRNPSKGGFMEMFCLTCNFAPIEVELTLPEIKFIDVRKGSTMTIEKWETNDDLGLHLSSGATIEFLEVDSPSLQADLKYGTYLYLTNGEIDSLDLSAEDGSNIELLEIEAEEVNLNAKYGAEINAYRAKLENVIASSEDGSNIVLGEVKNLEATARFGGLIQYEGKPNLTKSEESGGFVEHIEGAFIEGSLGDLNEIYGEESGDEIIPPDPEGEELESIQENELEENNEDSETLEEALLERQENLDKAGASSL